MDWYKILGVDEDAGQAEIRRAHRRCVRHCHPDSTGEQDANRFRDVQQAYEILSNPSSRAEYDRSRSTSVPVHIVSLDCRAWAEPLSPTGGPFWAEPLSPAEGPVETTRGARNIHQRYPGGVPTDEELVDDLFRLVDRFLWRF